MTDSFQRLDDTLSDLDFEDLLLEQGSFGKFQMLTYSILVVAINSGGYVMYSLAYLLLYPKYSCFRDNIPIEDSSLC